ncbi:hypothetical protein [Sphingomonas sp.]|uniref:hypothetical protein n=1 Tax=Sphingomonas sp. TaxID=28214 RepID=UPI0031CFDFA5
MEFLFEIMLQFVGEILLQVLFEFVVKLGLQGLGAPFSSPKSTLFKTFGYILWGAAAGGISLLIIPSPIIENNGLRIANLIITPIAAGSIMWLLARKKVRKGAPLVALDRFGYAFYFALAMSSVRFIWA